MSRSTRQSILKRLLGTVLGLLCAQVCCVRGAQVEQSPPVLSLQEGASSTLRCNFSISVSNVQWFRQHPGGRLISLFYVPSGTNKGRFTVSFNKSAKQFSLTITASQPEDSATYFCAASAQCSAGTCSPYPNLQLRLQLNPAV
uniref:Ig-like domain-containing protein n=1 Tax=Equus caballus TaxID=9796 RepID=F6YI10_HORSE